MTQTFAHLPSHGLHGLGVRKRTRVLQEATAVVGDPVLRASEPARWGSRVQLIYDLFAVYGWQGTGGQRSIAHNLGVHKVEILRECYEQWVEQQQQ